MKPFSVIQHIISIGISNALSNDERRHVRFLNVASLTILITLTVFALINLLYTGNYALALTEIGIMGFVVSLFYLNHIGRIELARFLFFLVLHLFLVSVTMYFKVGKMAEYMHLMMIMMLMYFYIQSKIFTFLYLLNIVLFYLPQLVYQPYPPENYSWMTPLVLFISMFIITKIYNKEQRNYQKRLDERNRRLQELNRQKDELVGIAAHDLKSPLNRIEALVSLIKMTSSNLTDEQKLLLDSVAKVSKDQNEMVRKVLDLSAINLKLENPETYQVNVQEILDSVIQEFSQISQNKNIDFRISYTGKRAYILGQRESLRNIFENLISNAVKFSPYNTTISVSARSSDDTVAVEISDQGPGFTEEDKKAMFRQFQKLSAQPTANESSNGLGLSIAKKYVEALKGKITCESTYGKGAKFTVQFDCVHQTDPDYI